jgi:hypothetical protein
MTRCVKCHTVTGERALNELFETIAGHALDNVAVMRRQAKVGKCSLDCQRQIAHRVREGAVKIEDDGFTRLNALHQAAMPAFAASRMAAMFFA